MIKIMRISPAPSPNMIGYCGNRLTAPRHLFFHQGVDC